MSYIKQVEERFYEILISSNIKFIEYESSNFNASTYQLSHGFSMNSEVVFVSTMNLQFKPEGGRGGARLS